MIKALDTATQGLLQAERRATDIARDILKNTSEAAAFNLDSDANTTQNTATQQENNAPTNASAVSNPGFEGNLVQQFADLRAEHRAFEANAKVFTEVDETLGTLLDAVG